MQFNKDAAITLRLARVGVLWVEKQHRDLE